MYNITTHDQQDRTDGITIRIARAEDREDLVRLAERDSRELPAGSILVGVVGGEIRAAVAVAAGEPIADPFLPSQEVVGLLTARVAQLRDRDDRGLRSRIRKLGSRGRLAPQPAGTLRAFD